MKTLKSFMLLIGIMLGSTAFYSCLDDNDDYYDFFRGTTPAIVTVKPLSESSYFMQLDDSTTLYPTNQVFPGQLKEIRALIRFKDDEKKEPGYDRTVQLVTLDTLLTKPIAPDLGPENDSYYGTDKLALNLAGGWSKNGVWIEDGYITFDFYIQRGYNENVKHFINLVQTNSADPYELEFRHNAYGDIDSSISPSAGLVSFKLDKLPSTEGKTVKLKIKYKSFATNDYNTVELDYKSKDAEDTED